jgi:hypothetical protein
MLIRETETASCRHRVELHQDSGETFSVRKFVGDQEVERYADIPTLEDANKRFDTVLACISKAFPLLA